MIKKLKPLPFKENYQIYHSLHDIMFDLNRTQEERDSAFKPKLLESLKNGYNINFYHNKTDGTLLQRAVVYGQDKIAIFLIEHGADVNILDSMYYNILMKAIDAYCTPDLISYLIAKTDNINQQSYRGRTAIGLLCSQYIISNFLSNSTREQEIKLINTLLSYGADPYLDSEWQNDIKSFDEKNRRELLKGYISTYLTKLRETQKSQVKLYEYEL